MSAPSPRVRVFAGPNGSGKSTIKDDLPAKWLGAYVNADEDKIISRYARSLALLPEAVAHTNRAYLFDNSGHERIWIAEITAGQELEMKTDRMPGWFKKTLWEVFEEADPAPTP